MPWTPNLSVGVSHIDEQHKTWFEHAEKLFEAGKNKQAKEYIGELLEFLDSYTKRHFSDEERYMRSINYRIRRAKQAHDNFIKKLADLRNEYKTSGGNILVIINANTMVIEWLTKHISNMDKKIGEFVAKQK